MSFQRAGKSTYRSAKRPISLLVASLLAALMFIVGADVQPASAGELCVALVSGDYHDPLIWSCGHVPVGTVSPDPFEIPAGIEVFNDGFIFNTADNTINGTFTITTSGSMLIQDGFYVNGTINNFGTIDAGSGDFSLRGTLYNNAGGIINQVGGGLADRGTIHNSGTITVWDGELGVYGGGSIINDGSINVTTEPDGDAGSIYNQGEIVNYGIINYDWNTSSINGGTITNNGTINSNGAWVQDDNNSVFNNNGALNIGADGGWVSRGTFTNNGTIDTSTDAFSIYHPGTFYNNGTIIIRQLFGNGGTFYNDGTIDNLAESYSYGTLYNNGTLNNPGEFYNDGTFYNDCAGVITGNPVLNRPVIQLPCNQPPEVDAGSAVTILEGETFVSSGSFVDPDADVWSATVDYDEGAESQSLPLNGFNFDLNNVYELAGTYTVTVAVYDGEDTGSDTVIVTVQTPPEAIQDLIDLVEEINTEQEIANNSLDAKLDAALNALDDANANNDGAAINTLQAFINTVEAQRGTKLTNAQADQLIAAAQAIIDSLSA